MILTNSNTTLLCAGAKAPPGSYWSGQFMVRSSDAGQTWSDPVKQSVGCDGEPVYSRTTNTIIRLGANPKKKRPRATTPTVTTLSPATERHAEAPLRNQAALPGPKWAKDLTPLSASDLAKCESWLVKSTDEGKSWSDPQRISVSGSLGPHYIGNGLNHGIEIQNGPYKGRLAAARRFDCPAAMGDHGRQEYFHSYVLYSDNQGANWTVGQLLPQGSTECQIAEMQNGSLLMTSRMYGSPWLSVPPKPSDLRRMFARSDDGGATWSEWWFVEQRQPAEGWTPGTIWTGTCDQALASNPSVSPTMYYAHPGNDSHYYGKDDNGLARANYTLHQSHDGGASWEFVNRIYPLGAGYSDANIVPDPAAAGGYTLLMSFQKTFNPPVQGVEGGGYDIAVARLPLPGNSESASCMPSGVACKPKLHQCCTDLSCYPVYPRNISMGYVCGPGPPSSDSEKTA